jgi:prepilin-type processing-associated H-X9-DG protein
MYSLGPNEKTTPVVVYARNKLIQGDLVTIENARVSIWLRMQNLPNYIHLLKANILFFDGSAPKSLEFNEYYFPIERIIAFHLAPPAIEQLDYNPDASDRTLVDVSLILGEFLLKGKIRLSTRADFATGLELSHMTWLSVYEAEITSPFLAQIPVIHTPMMLVNPRQVSFGI